VLRAKRVSFGSRWRRGTSICMMGGLPADLLSSFHHDVNGGDGGLEDLSLLGYDLLGAPMTLLSSMPSDGWYSNEPTAMLMQHPNGEAALSPRIAHQPGVFSLSHRFHQNRVLGLLLGLLTL
jgi:hypothetical protein